MRKPDEFANFPEALRCPYSPYMAVVMHIVDGDSFYAMFDVGVNEYPFREIRIRGIDAPELFTGTKRAEGKAARDYLAWLMPEGTPVKLDTERDVQTFGRYVADVTLADGRDVGDEMIRASMAVEVER